MSSKYAKAMFDGIEWEHYPIYITLIAIVGFQAMMFIIIASEHGATPTEVKPVTNTLRILMYFLAVIPLLGGVANVALVWYRGESDV